MEFERPKTYEIYFNDELSPLVIPGNTNRFETKWFEFWRRVEELKGSTSETTVSFQMLKIGPGNIVKSKSVITFDPQMGFNDCRCREVLLTTDDRGRVVKEGFCWVSEVPIQSLPPHGDLPLAS